MNTLDSSGAGAYADAGGSIEGLTDAGAGATEGAGAVGAGAAADSAAAAAPAAGGLWSSLMGGLRKPSSTVLGKIYGKQ